MSDALESQGVVLKINNEAGSPTNLVTIGEVVDFTGPGGSATVIDVSNLDSTRREKLIGLPDEGQVSMNLNLVPSNEGQRQCWEARANRDKREFTMTLTDTAATVLTFDAFCLEFSISGATDDKITASITLEITGAVTGFPVPVS